MVVYDTSNDALGEGSPKQPLLTGKERKVQPWYGPGGGHLGWDGAVCVGNILFENPTFSQQM